MTTVTEVTRAFLRRTPLPQPDEGDDKDSRGRVLAVGGSARVPGAILLAGIAALRAGAGKLQLASVASVASALGIAVPESLVVALPADGTGEIDGEGAAAILGPFTKEADAVLIGPGMTSVSGARALVTRLARCVGENAALIIDAAAIVALHDGGRGLDFLAGRAVLTPHAGEMASLLGIDRSDVERDRRAAARDAAGRFNVVVVLKGAESWIADPDGSLFHFGGGSVGLATSGSGDTLAGVVAGLAARGARPVQAATWGTYVHGAAGRALGRRIGPIGYLARELLDEIPPLLARLR